ncbi:isochorismatase family protein [Kushneria aurantia]|uniref:Isochorismatase family protein n=1 Tax=Kushneria aurantia TaxID=504092 RepID=A0ABV6G629_9GAMM|nr:isochorismatase family protein [Kushneria aurantia]
MQLDPARTALISIDLQQGIVGRELAPRSGEQIVAATRALAERFRRAGALVVNVRVLWHDDLGDTPPANVDKPPQRPEGGMPADAMRFVDGVMQPGDLEIVKRQWGAFHGTELDLQLRRRGISTLVIGGIATNFGVESTVRDAWEYGYDVVVPEDLCATMSKPLHDMAIESIFPRLARVTNADALELVA